MMYKNKKIICIIPARSGSKALPNKNIKNLCGKPLIFYTIKSAMDADIFDCIYVSTDSEEYADIAKKCGAEVPFLREIENASDIASSWDVVRETIYKFEAKDIYFDIVALLQPTSPLRISQDILNSLDICLKKNANLVINVCEPDHSPLLVNTLGANGEMDNFFKNPLLLSPRQNLPKHYRINGAGYYIKVDYLKNNDNINIGKEKCYASVMPRERSIDIDTEYDFQIAKFTLEHMEDIK